MTEVSEQLLFFRWTKTFIYDIIYLPNIKEVSALISKIDELLFRYAGWLIKVAAFFGISRWQLIVIWVWISSFIFALPSDIRHPWALVISAIVGVVLFSKTMDDEVGECYRNDDILSSHPLIIMKKFRLYCLFGGLLFGIAFAFSLYDPRSLFFLLPAKIIFSIYFWPYFCLHQSPKDPVTLRKWIGSLAAKKSAQC